MVKKKSKLTWYEEWFMYYERLYSRSISRWEDYERLYKRSGPVLREVFDSKLQIAIECRLRWPRYCRLREDEQLRQSHWNDTYGGTRVVMWDNTNINLPKPQDAEAQRNTWSTYYGGNVGKGAIFIQLCGWMGTYEIWMGAVTDSDYFIRSGILKEQ